MTTKEQASKALLKAAARIGANGHKAAWQKATPAQRKACSQGKRAVYHPTPEHVLLIKASRAVLGGYITEAEAMGLLWLGDVMIQRGVY